ncbi:DUF2007 domain-containing protein [Christiangramia sp. SM2212]|uniref:DUF2007 domain-containing protein n=1 Tax=Christiangramia sediminicola TaxID=3073267 RepID=A0ABU1ESI2_9FLAO|nr:DUF2007 domain-containing protein [Christiangramia sp. SM2212]MDR5591355.1 DUF2007 domain-containing protein [Christiangramia sp. SM2212]
MKDYQCLATFTYHHEYFVLKLQFEKAGIRHYFQNETLIGLLPLSSFAFGGIRLMIHPSDISKAKQIIDSLNDKSSNLRIV